MKVIKNSYFKKGEFIEIEDIPIKIIYTHHSEDQMRNRVISKERVESLIRKGLLFLLEDARKNLNHKNSCYSELINTQSFRVVVFANWSSDFSYLSVVVITVIWDFYRKRRKKKSNTNVYRL